MYSENQQDFENAVKEIREELINYNNFVKRFEVNYQRRDQGYVITDWTHYTDIMKQTIMPKLQLG